MLGCLAEMGDRDRLALRRRLAERAVAGVDRAMGAFGCLVDADRFRQVELMIAGVIAIDQHGVGMRNLKRAGGDCRQHRVEIERGGDRAADFLEHLEFVDRLRQIPRPLLHLLFEAGIGRGELARHAVELVGELFELVGGLHFDAVAEIAGAETPCAGLQRRDRHQHAARHDRAGDDRDHEAEPDQKRDSHQLITDRRQRLRGLLFEEHVPAELRHGGRRRQHRMSVQISARRRRRAARRECGGDLRQLPRDSCRPPGPWRSSQAPRPWDR